MESNKVKKAEIKKEKTCGILTFPNKLNGLAIILLTTAYAAIIFWALYSFFPKYNYVVVPDYEHLAYNYEIDPYIKSTNSITSDANGNVTVKHSFAAYIYNNYATALNNVRFQFSGLDKEGSVDYISGTDYWSSTSAPTIHTMMSNQTVGGGAYEKIFGKIQYKINKSETEVLDRTVTFAEEIIELKKSELGSSKFKDLNVFAGKFSFTVKANEPVSDSSNYTFTNTITFNNPGEKFHFDYQAFIVTKDKEIYPIGGLYNYFYFSTEAATISMTSKANKTIDIEYVYVKAYYTDNNKNVTEVFYKVDLATLLG